LNHSRKVTLVASIIAELSPNPHLVDVLVLFLKSPAGRPADRQVGTPVSTFHSLPALKVKRKVIFIDLQSLDTCLGNSPTSHESQKGFEKEKIAMK